MDEPVLGAYSVFFSRQDSSILNKKIIYSRDLYLEKVHRNFLLDIEGEADPFSRLKKLMALDFSRERVVKALVKVTELALVLK
uniref:Uncharacterized protein n=1 Tax=Desertifilum tharense IPPAS B-1220 TaxID=1781255 RepID=A0ACD5GMB7_9CYAN